MACPLLNDYLDPTHKYHFVNIPMKHIDEVQNHFRPGGCFVRYIYKNADGRLCKKADAVVFCVGDQ